MTAALDPDAIAAQYRAAVAQRRAVKAERSAVYARRDAERRENTATIINAANALSAEVPDLSVEDQTANSSGVVVRFGNHSMTIHAQDSGSYNPGIAYLYENGQTRYIADAGAVVAALVAFAARLTVPE